jgi:ATP-binding cassette, subfamily C, bacterial
VTGELRSERRRSSGTHSVGAYLRCFVSFAAGKVWVTLGLMICVSATEGVGILLLLPLLGLAGVDLGQGATGHLSATVSSAFGALGVRLTLLPVLTAYVCVVSARAVLQRWSVLSGRDLQERFLLYLRQRLYRAIINARWIALSRSRTAELHYALTEQLERAGDLPYQLLTLCTHVLIGAVYLLMALRLSAAMTAVAVACGGGLLLLLWNRTGQARQAGERLYEATGSMFAATSEHLGGLKAAKSYGAEERSAAIFSELSAGVAQANLRTARLFANVRAMFDIGSVVVLSVVVSTSIAVLRLSSASVLLLLFLFARLVPRFSGLQGSYNQLVHELPAFSSVIALIERYESWSEPKGSASAPTMLGAGVSLHGVSFSYEGGRAAVSTVNLLVPARRTTAIVGPSGAGKSTIADLVMGLLLPDEGHVAVDGAALTPERIRAWREQIGYVAQDTFLFHDTVRANLLWARPDASDAELEECLRRAAADGFVHRLPRGLDTVIGDRGTSLSGGERQRLALARALLRAPSLLILDEATSAVDAENELRIQRAVEELHDHVAVLLITHRISTVRVADAIYVVEGGRVVESGSWDELLARGGRFAALWRAQVGIAARGNGEAAADLQRVDSPGSGSRPPTKIKESVSAAAT